MLQSKCITIGYYRIILNKKKIEKIMFSLNLNHSFFLLLFRCSIWEVVNFMQLSIVSIGYTSPKLSISCIPSAF